VAAVEAGNEDGPVVLRKPASERGNCKGKEMTSAGTKFTVRSPAKLAGRAAGDQCGCVMGARFLGVGMCLSMFWCGWHWRSGSLTTWGVCWRVMLFSFAAAALGKIVGILAFRIRAADSHSERATPKDYPMVLGRGRLDSTIMAAAGQVSRRILERYRRTRMEAKRTAMAAPAGSTKTAGYETNHDTNAVATGAGAA